MRFQRAVADVRQQLIDRGTRCPEQLAAHLAEQCAARTNAAGVGISLTTEHGAEAILAATDEVAITLQELQFNYGEGPCTTTVETRSPVLQSDLALTGHARWPIFTESALGAGARAVFAFPLRFGNVHLGALELYRCAPGPLSWVEHYQAQVYTEAALTLMIHTQAGIDFGTLFPHLTKVLDDRIEVHRATGMVAVQAGVSMDDALSLLRAHAFARDQSVLDLSIDLVDRVTTMGPV